MGQEHPGIQTRGAKTPHPGPQNHPARYIQGRKTFLFSNYVGQLFVLTNKFGDHSLKLEQVMRCE